ncbi:MAG: site-specific integrase [Gallionella sp.]|nr:site-specific integrase [Gallionella sp.]
MNGTGASTFNKSLALISAIQNLSGIKPVKVPKKPIQQGRTRWLTAEEWVRLHKALKTFSPTLADAAEFSISTGLRENNALELEWSQVDLRRKVAWIYADQAKAGQPIGVPLNEGAMAVLAKRLGIHEVFVFPCPDTGKPYHRASTESWYSALRKAKLYKTGVVWHSLRHTWASWHVMNGTRLEELMALGGWKSYAMVKRYAHLSTEHLAGVAANAKPVSLRHGKQIRGKI